MMNRIDPIDAAAERIRNTIIVDGESPEKFREAIALRVADIGKPSFGASEWRDVVDDMLSVCHAVASDDPRESINRLITWHVQVALDPSVSSDAQALIDRGRSEGRAEVHGRMQGGDLENFDEAS